MVYLLVGGLKDDTRTRDDTELTQSTKNTMEQVGVLRRRALDRVTGTCISDSTQ